MSRLVSSDGLGLSIHICSRNTLSDYVSTTAQIETQVCICISYTTALRCIWIIYARDPRRRGITNIYAGELLYIVTSELENGAVVADRSFAVIGLSTLANLTNENLSVATNSEKTT